MSTSTATKIRYAEPSETALLARLHREHVRDPFLSTLGKTALRTYYKTVIADLRSMVMVAQQGDRVLGFAAASLDGGASVLRRAPLVGLAALPQLLRPSAAKRAIRAATEEPRIAAPDAELIAIVVEPSARRAGVGRALVGAMSAELRAGGARGMRAAIDKDLHEANRFFAALGFAIAGTVEVAGGRSSVLWTTTWRS